MIYDDGSNDIISSKSVLDMQLAINKGHEKGDEKGWRLDVDVASLWNDERHLIWQQKILSKNSHLDKFVCVKDYKGDQKIVDDALKQDNLIQQAIGTDCKLVEILS